MQFKDERGHEHSHTFAGMYNKYVNIYIPENINALYEHHILYAVSNY